VLDFPPETRDSITEIDGNMMNLIRTRVKDPGLWHAHSHRSGTFRGGVRLGQLLHVIVWVMDVLVGY
jgi:hypothetical protein